VSSVKCFIVGASRSGTTLLSVLLDRHSLLAVPPETAFYRDLARHFEGVDRARALELLSTWHRLPELGLAADDIISACDADISARSILETALTLYTEARGKRFSGEKTPGHVRSIDRIITDFPDAHILFMMRDGRDMALSLVTMPFWKPDLAAAAGQWLSVAAAYRQAIDRHPGRISLIRYEQLAVYPERVLRSIMPSLGLAFEAGQLDHTIASDVVLPRSMAWKGRALTPIDTARIGHWRNSAKPAEAAYLTRMMHDELTHFGYDSSELAP